MAAERLGKVGDQPMASRMLKFVKLARAMPEKRSADLRRRDFGEIYDEYDSAASAPQASRRSPRGLPFCQVQRPLPNNIPDGLIASDEGTTCDTHEPPQQHNNYTQNPSN